jgi:PhnB protein
MVTQAAGIARSTGWPTSSPKPLVSTPPEASSGKNHDHTPKAEELPPELGDRVMHATLLLGKDKILASDAPSQHYRTPQGFHINVNIEDPSEAEKIYGRLADGGTQTMPIAETFWAQRFGTCVDRFGTPWMVNCEKPRS